VPLSLVLRARRTSRHIACSLRRMQRRARLGRVFDVDVSIDWSWFVAFGIGTWTLLTLGPRVFPALPPGEIAALAILGTVGALAALALHELARDITARACGVPVRRVTMFLFGAVTDADKPDAAHQASPRGEALAAIAATGVSALVGTACLVGADVFSGELERGGPGAILLAWVGAANLFVAAVNLLPAYPLDGGRILRAIIWRLTGDVERATRISAWTAEVIGWSAVVVGVALVFATREVGMAAGMWITLAGWFLAAAAAEAYERTFRSTSEW
jgi:Zn-dependent protease